MTKLRRSAINLISGPRNVSTALMYSFAQRPDMAVTDEPFYAHYLQETGTQHPGRDEVLEAQPHAVSAVIQQMNGIQPLEHTLFIKNMAHHLHYVNNRFLHQVLNVFLIREPEEMLLSFIRKIPNPTLQDTAYADQFQLFEYVTQTRNQPVIVIDSAELLKAPRAVLHTACRKLDIPFYDDMMSWEKGPITADGVWARYWYGSVHSSTGFKPYTPKTEPVPGRLQSLLETCKQYYEPMYRHAIKAPVE